MKQKTKLIISVSMLLIAIFLLTGLIIISVKKISDIELPTYLVTPTSTIDIKETSIIATPQVTVESTPFIEPTSTAKPTPTVEPTNLPYAQPDNPQAIARITIETDRKTRTYDIMPDVDESTLKKNLGHLPTSDMFGEEGLCVIMGHRDTQFSILKYCEIGDSITILSNERFYVYYVYDIQIVESDNLLQLDAVSGTNIALVTCYPFRYTGHAPNKIIVYGLLN